MSKEKIDFETGAIDRGEDTGSSAPQGKANSRQSTVRVMTSRRLWPVYFAGTLSLLWIAAIFWLAGQQGLLSGTADISIGDIALYAAGLTSPIVVFWLVALVYQRTDPLLERRVEIAQGMNETLAPIDRAEKRLSGIAANIDKQVHLIEAASEIAENRIQNLEGRFQEQVNNLFNATTDAEAKAASFKDMLKRERLAMEKYAQDLDKQIAKIESDMEGLTSAVEEATLHAKEEAEKAGQHMGDHLGAMRLTAGDTEDILKNIGDALDRQKQEIAATSRDVRNQMEEAFEAIMGRTGNLAREIERLEERAITVAKSVNEQAGNMASAAEDAAQHASDFEATIVRQTEALSNASTGALAQAAQAGDEFERQAQSMEKVASETLDRAEHIFVEAGRSIAASSSAAESTAKASAELAIGHVQRAAEQIEALSAGLRDKAKDAASETLGQLQALRQGLEAQAALIGNAGDENVERVKLMTAQLSDQAQLIATAADDATNKLEAAGAVMDKRNENLGQVLDDTKRRLIAVDEQINIQRQTLSDATSLSAGMLHDAAQQMQETTQGLKQTAESVTGDITAQSEALQDQMGKIGDRGTVTTEAFTMASQKLRRENDNFSNTIKSNLSAFGDVVETYAQARADFVEHSGKIIEDIQTGANALLQGTTLLVHSGESGVDRMDVLSKRVASTAEATEATVDQMANRLRLSIATAKSELKESIDDLSNRAEYDLGDLHARFSKELNKAITELEVASKRARKEARDGVTDISLSAQQLSDTADAFTHQKEAFGETIKAAVKDDFGLTSSLLIESLSSASVDLARLMDVEISETAWQKYLEGDKGVFARKAVKVGDSKSRKIIRKRFREDEEFKNIASKFMRDFDSLLARSSGEARANAFTITLMSSDMGKIFALMKDALEK